MRFLAICLVALVPRGCPVPPPEPRPPEPAMADAPWRPTAHLPGTLLRDAGGRYWVVGRWPDRNELLPWMPAANGLRREEAVPLSVEEAVCLRPSAVPWLAPRLWRLRVLRDGSLWYVDEPEGYRRLARSAVMLARHDDPARADPLDLDAAGFAERFRDLGPQPPPDGSLFRVGDEYFLYAEGERHAFPVPLLREAGYDPSWAAPIAPSELDALGELGPELTRTTFSVCPLAAAQLRRTEDRDRDGVPFFDDCDDEDATRHPGHPEICDGVDNDCDLVADNGFDVGRLCRMDDACRSVTYTRCAADRLHTECEDDEVICAE